MSAAGQERSTALTHEAGRRYFFDAEFKAKVSRVVVNLEAELGVRLGPSEIELATLASACAFVYDDVSRRGSVGVWECGIMVEGNE